MMSDLNFIFEINENLKVDVEYYKDTKIFYINNFYKRPNEIVHWMMKQPVSLWKSEQKPSFNGIYFFDYRHILNIKELYPVYEFVKKICVNAEYDETLFLTNITQFVKDKFNDYSNNYWWPHKDKGYTAIIYLNENESSGTNLYEQIEKDLEKKKEHEDPWRNKKYWKLSKCLMSSFNRMIVFEADKIFHGASIEDDTFFSEYRMNQVLFFDRV